MKIRSKKKMAMPFLGSFRITRCNILLAIIVLQLLICAALLQYNFSSSDLNHPDSRTAAALEKQEFSTPTRHVPPTSRMASRRRQQPSVLKSSSFTFHATRLDKKHNKKHQLERVWTPPLSEIYQIRKQDKLTTLERLFFEQQVDTPATHTNKPHVDLLAFVRIPKTGSTSVMNFLSSHLAPLHKALPLDMEALEEDEVNLSGIPECVFGKRGPHYHRRKTGECRHNYLGGTMRHLAHALAYAQLETETDINIHPFAMFRDPFTRMVSLFRYMQNVNWNHKLKPKQKRALKDNDLEGFWRSIYEQKTDQNKGMLSQQSYVSTNQTRAEEWIAKGRIVVLVMECFDVSMLLLAQLFPQVLDGQDTMAFLKDDDRHHLNKAKDKQGDDGDDDEDDDDDDDDDDGNEDDDGNKDDDSTDEANGDDDSTNNDSDPVESERRRLSEMTEPEMEALRIKATKWFPHHFAFHQVVLTRFQVDVLEALRQPNSLLTQTQVDQCFATLRAGGMQSRQ